MNTPDPHSNADLESGLAAHLDAIRATTDLSGLAIERAAGIRRRRRAAAGVTAALAVTTITAPLVWWNVRDSSQVVVPATSSTTSGSSSPAPTSTSTAPTPTTTSAAPTTSSTPTATAIPTYDSDRSSPVVARVSMSGALGTPDVPFLTDGSPSAGVRTLHTQSAAVRLDLPADAVLSHAWGPLAGGGMAVSTLLAGESEWGLDFLDSSGRRVSRTQRASVVVVNASGDRLAYLDAGGYPSDADDAMHLLDASGREAAVLPGLRFPVGVIGDIVYANDERAGTAIAWDSRSDSVKVLGTGRITAVHEASASAVFWPGLGTPGASTECFSLVTLRDAAMTTRWTSCGQRFAPESFSPSGAYLIGGAELEGGSPDRRRVLRTSDARFVLDLDGAPNQLMLRDTVFTPDEDAVVLAATDEDLNLGLVRCTLTGACQPIVKPLPMDTTHPSGFGIEPYQLVRPTT